MYEKIKEYLIKNPHIDFDNTPDVLELLAKEILDFIGKDKC